MTTRDDYITGWADTTIHEFLMDLDEPTSTMSYALITCLDSSPNVSAMLGGSGPLTKFRGKFQAVGKGLLTTTRQLLRAERSERIFFGFDELWFFPDSEVSAKPDGLAIRGPRKLGPAILDDQGQWLRSTNCSLGLGDGTGLNYCVRVRGPARKLIKMHNELGLQR